jgi:RHS repeat-associated protein
MAKVNPFLFSTKYYDWETGLYYYGYRYYNPSTGRWLSRDPLGEQGGKNLYCLCFDCPIDGVDPLGMGFLEDTANFAGGVGDSLTFGLTREARKGLDWMLFDEYDDGGVNPRSGAYVAGEVTEVTVEIVVTAGGATLRQTARLTVREALEGGARAAFRRENNLVGGFIHHINPIKGHPGGAIARYPLPFEWAARGKWNMKWVPSEAAHLAEHDRMLALEALDEVREATMLVRQAGNEVGVYIEGQRPCFDDWSVDVFANVSGTSAQDGAIPETPATTIDASADYFEMGLGGTFGGGE